MTEQGQGQTKKREFNQALIILSIIAIVVLGFVLFYESENSCYERLVADFEGVQDRMDSLERSGSVTQLDIAEYKLEAIRSVARVGMILRDNDQNACDYISDGPTLRRK